MIIIRPILIFIEVICSFLLIGIVLLQKTKREGLGLAFGAGVGESLFGSRAGNILTKTTVVLAIVFLLNTALISLTYSGIERQSVVDKYPERAAAPTPGRPPQTPGTQPGGPAPAPTAPVDATSVGDGTAPEGDQEISLPPDAAVTMPSEENPAPTAPNSVPTPSLPPATPEADTAPAP